jgi:hypothetical protein
MKDDLMMMPSTLESKRGRDPDNVDEHKPSPNPKDKKIQQDGPGGKNRLRQLQF